MQDAEAKPQAASTWALANKMAEIAQAQAAARAARDLKADDSVPEWWKSKSKRQKNNDKLEQSDHLFDMHNINLIARKMIMLWVYLHLVIQSQAKNFDRNHAILAFSSWFWKPWQSTFNPLNSIWWLTLHRCENVNMTNQMFQVIPA